MKPLLLWMTLYVLPPAALLVLVLLSWSLVVRYWQIPAYLLPGPAAVWEEAARHRADLTSAAELTAAGALAGLVTSLVVGSVVGFVFAQSPLVARSVYPYAIFLQTVPIVAVAPLVITWCGPGFTSVVVVSFILSVFPIITNTTAGLTSIEPALLELFELNNASRWQTLIKLRVPHAVPHLVVGARIACGLSVIGAIVGEMFAGYGTDSFGLGYLIKLTSGRLETAYAFAAVISSTLLGIIMFGAVNLLSATVLGRWHVNRKSTTVRGA